MTTLVTNALADGVRFDLRPDKLTPDLIEPGIWPAVQRINKSGWALTRYCCEGHLASPDDPEGIRMYPYIQVACRREDLLRLVKHMDDVACDAKLAGELVALHGTVLSANWRAFALCFARPQRHHGSCMELILSARRRLEHLADQLCTSR